MMKNKDFADCGCAIKELPKPSFVWDFDGDGNLAVSMETMCDECFITDDENGEILTRDDILEFFNGQIAITSNMKYSGDKY
jgi:hypothetical protein